MRNLMLIAAAAMLAVCQIVKADIPAGGQPDIITVEGGQVLGVQIPASNIRVSKTFCYLKVGVRLLNVTGELSLQYWLGIPYADTTGGVNQWMPPQPRPAWDFTMDCTDMGAGCYSTDHNPDTVRTSQSNCSNTTTRTAIIYFMQSKNMSMDCLNVNVYAPLNAKNLPVMLFLYGGAFKEGDNAGPFGIYSGAYIASTRNVIVIAANYRLGAMGFLVTDTLRGNFGLMDQRAAMQWVQRNAATFGGDPTQVTLWGESAGAMSIGFHLTSPKSRGLFSKAIMESNPSGFNYKNLSEAAIYGQTFCGYLNCSSSNKCDTDCIRAADPTAIVSAWGKAAGNAIDFILADWGHLLDGFLQFTPVIDGDEVTMEPIAALESGNWDSSVPLLFGTNTNEGETFVYSAVGELPGWLVKLALELIYSPAAASEITALPRYNTSVTDGRIPLSNIITDYWFRCGSAQFAIAAAKAGTQAFVYRFDHLFSHASIFPTFGLPAVCAGLVCHASELPFMFHNDVPSANATFSPAEVVFSTTLVDYWTSFAITGNPNTLSNQAFKMPLWDSVNRTNAVLNLTMTTESSAQLCNVWDRLGYFF